MDFKQTGKRRDRSSDFNRSFKVLSPDCREAGLEEGSAPEELESRRLKRRSNARKEPTLTQEINASGDDDMTQLHLRSGVQVLMRSKPKTCLSRTLFKMP